MSDMAEGFRALDQYHKEQRAAARASAPELLTAAGIAFTEHNGGAHLVVKHGGKRVDFWPGPGKWRDYSNKKRGYDIESLIQHVGGSLATKGGPA